MSLSLVVRCDDNDGENEEEEYGSDNNNYANYGDYEPPTKEYASDPKIVSRNVKCLGKLIPSFNKKAECFCTAEFVFSVPSNNTRNGKCNQKSRSTEESRSERFSYGSKWIFRSQISSIFPIGNILD